MNTSYILKSCFCIVTSATNAVQSSGKQKSGRGRKKVVGKRQADEGADSVINSKVGTSTAPSTLTSNSAVGSSGPQSALDSSTRGKWQELTEACYWYQNCEMWLLFYSCLSICPSTRNVSAPTGRIFIKFDILI